MKSERWDLNVIISRYQVLLASTMIHFAPINSCKPEAHTKGECNAFPLLFKSMGSRGFPRNAGVILSAYLSVSAIAGISGFSDLETERTDEGVVKVENRPRHKSGVAATRISHFVPF
jgi:hypothetical protein